MSFRTIGKKLAGVLSRDKRDKSVELERKIHKGEMMSRLTNSEDFRESFALMLRQIYTEQMNGLRREDSDKNRGALDVLETINNRINRIMEDGLKASEALTQLKKKEKKYE